MNQMETEVNSKPVSATGLVKSPGDTLFGVGIGPLSETVAIKGTSDVIELTHKIK